VSVNVNPEADPNTVHPQGEAEPYWELIAELRDRVRSLEKANRENRRIIAAVTSRIPDLPTPPMSLQEPSESPQAATASSEGTRPAQMPEARRRAHSARGGGGCSVAELRAAWVLDYSSVEGRTLWRTRKKPRRSIRGGKG
jgi:hypothetical protein